jgi:succinate dehydrogenase / fumarate reductase flavoprotein subunit
VEGDISQYPAASYAAELVRKLFLEIRKGNGPLYVDQRASEAIDSKLLIKAWEQRRHLIRSLGIDPRQNRIEIVLGSHFSMGGVKVNAKTETTVPGLFAPGEIMGAVHGACRLSGYSFSQMIVFGFEAGKQAAAYARQTEGEGPVSEGELEEEEKHLRRYLEPKAEPLSVHAVKDRLKQVMEEHVFVVRDADGLKEAVRKIDAIEEDMIRIQVPSLLRFNLEWKRAIEFPFMVDAARIATLSALAREESRGSHYRSDFPYEDNGRWLCHTLARCESGRPTIGTFPVELPYLRPEECHA